MNAQRWREVYKECHRNHSARFGGYATDGCCEFAPADAGGLHCTACGCHRSFHRKVYLNSSAVVPGGRCPFLGQNQAAAGGDGRAISSVPRRRPRTKFSEEQKGRMASFAESVGWRLPKTEGDGESDEISRFCEEIGVSRRTFKVWIHNHKGKMAAPSSTSNTTSAPVQEKVGDEEDKAVASMEEN